jgi:hypothetical protein
MLHPYMEKAMMLFPQRHIGAEAGEWDVSNQEIRKT